MALDTKPARSISELRDRIITQILTAKIDEAELTDYIKTMSERLFAVGSTQSRFFARLLRERLAEIQGRDIKISGRADQLNSLKTLAVFAGSIQMGWI